jgi:hypothetical protein
LRCNVSEADRDGRGHRPVDGVNVLDYEALVGEVQVGQVDPAVAAFGGDVDG